MHKGNVKTNGGGPRSWRKCLVCGKVIKGERKSSKHYQENHKV